MMPMVESMIISRSPCCCDSTTYGILALLSPAGRTHGAACVPSFRTARARRTGKPTTPPPNERLCGDRRPRTAAFGVV
jgi:hypothetical protein